MIHTNKIAYLYLSILITAMVSMALPNPLYMAIIFVMNMSVTLCIITSNPEQPVINKISLWMMVVSAFGFNLWAAYQSISYFTLNYSSYLTLVFYILIYYFLAIITFKPSIIMNTVIYLKKVFKGFLHIGSKNNNIDDKTMIFDVIKKTAKSSKLMSLTVDNKSLTEAKIISFNDSVITLVPSPDLIKFSKNTLTKIFDVRLMHNGNYYFFKSSFTSLDPIEITLPTTLFLSSETDKSEKSVIEDVIKPPFDLSTLKSSIICGKKNIEFDIKSIKDTSISFTTNNQMLLNSIKSSTEYIEIVIFIKGSIVKIQILIDSTLSGEEFTTFNATIKNISKKDKDLLLSIIS